MLTTLNTALYRIVFAEQASRVLNGVIHPEGRFHHDGQAALYASPTRQSAAVAIDIYLRPDDPPRVIVPLQLRGGRLADLREPDTCKALGIEPAWPSVPWADQRRAGTAATSWLASDAARAAGADGMIYASRRVPTRWHVVLFRWNGDDGAQLSYAGDAVPWVAA